MPSKYTTYDFNWRNAWIKSNKRFWFYTNPLYYPTHTDGQKMLFAGAWASKGGWSHEEWNRVFNNWLEDNQTDTNYGVDERCLKSIFKNHEYSENTYYVGLTQFYSLFYNSTKIDSYDTKINLDVSREHLQVTPETSQVLQSINAKYYGSPKNFYWNNISFFSEIKCLLFQIINYLECKGNKNVTVDILMFEIENLKKKYYAPINRIESFLLRWIIKALPTRSHLYEYVFD